MCLSLSARSAVSALCGVRIRSATGEHFETQAGHFQQVDYGSCKGNRILLFLKSQVSWHPNCKPSCSCWRTASGSSRVGEGPNEDVRVLVLPTDGRGNARNAGWHRHRLGVTLHFVTASRFRDREGFRCWIKWSASLCHMPAKGAAVVRRWLQRIGCPPSVPPSSTGKKVASTEKILWGKL